MAATRYLDQDPQYEDDNGAPLNGGTLTFYVTGTTTPANTYSDTGLVTANPNPITLDADGRSPVEIFLDSTVTYRSILKDSAGVTLSDKDPVSLDNATAAVAAHDVSVTAHYAATESQRGFVELATNTEAQAGTATDRVLTPANLQAVTATATRKGIVELATNTEAQTGTDTSRALTAANLQAVTATETRAGVAEVATDAEALAGTADDKMMTPLKISSLVGSRVIATGTLGLGDNSITIPTNTFPRIKVLIQGVEAADDYIGSIRLNSDSSASYVYSLLVITDAAASAAQGSGSGTPRNIIAAQGYNNLIDASGTQNPSDIELTIERPNSSTKYKSIRIRSSLHRRPDALYEKAEGEATWLSTSAVASVQLLLRDTLGQNLAGTTVNASAGTYTVTGEN